MDAVAVRHGRAGTEATSPSTQTGRFHQCEGPGPEIWVLVAKVPGSIPLALWLRPPHPLVHPATLCEPSVVPPLRTALPGIVAAVFCRASSHAPPPNLHLLAYPRPMRRS